MMLETFASPILAGLASRQFAPGMQGDTLTMSARNMLQLSMSRHGTYGEAFTASSQHH